ncbi:hypothetical protein A5761_09795 [Mycolicibacterium setense]|nr:hypothetical protein A5761_09795 [Mycolicibacterium setense]
MPRLESGADDTADEAAFRARARQWLEVNAPPRGPVEWEVVDLGASIVESRAFQSKLAVGGLAGISIPTCYGGAGLTVREELIWSEESAGYPLPINGLMLGLHLCAPTLLALGSEELKQRLIGPLLRADHIWCQLFSEPGAGSDLGAVDTRARRDGDDWVISGQKTWNSVAQFADMGMLVARTGSTESRHRGLTMFAIDMAAPGVTVRPIRQITGVEDFNEVFLDEVRVPHAHVIGEVDGGWSAVLTMLMNERVALASSGSLLGADITPIVEIARSTGARFEPEFRQRFAMLFTRVVSISLLAERLKASLRGHEFAPGPEGSIAKLMMSQVLRERADLMLDAARDSGAWWSLDEPGSERWAWEFLAAPAVSLGGGTDAIQRNVLAERILGMPREPSAYPRPGAKKQGV